ncbi:MAG: anthranilate phosphoribosyltransferase [Ponticaulis sp.]|nr:anthranilate phosphoribosyltransferase [Ponticaulis sp.]
MTASISPAILTAIQAIARKEEVSPETLTEAFKEILGGDTTPERISAFLMGLAVRGETSAELYAGASVMRQFARKIDLGKDVLDTCGTGGLGWTSLNTSTASAILLAACGVPVAKHGNRSVPPKTGSADVLEALGVGLELTEDQFRNSIETAGIGFLFARSHHSAMRHVAPIRASLAIRTIFNLLGPLSSPVSASHQILGVYDPHWLHPMAETLQKLGVKRAWVVHGTGSDRAIDELSTEGPTQVIEVTEGGLREFEIQAADAGLTGGPLSELAGGSPEHNAKAITDLFDGQTSVFRDAVLLNTAGGLVVFGKATDLKEGVALASDVLASGAPVEVLEKLKTASGGVSEA